MKKDMPGIILRWVALFAALCSGTASAGHVRFGFTGGSLAPTLVDVPAGVTVELLVLGAKFSSPAGTAGNVFDEGADPDGIRITAADGTGAATGTSITAGTTLSFTVHIPAGVTVGFQSLTLRYKGTNVTGRSNARVFSSIRGSASASADTVGILGRDGEGTDSTFVQDTVNLAVIDAEAGTNIQAGDFTNLSNRSVTFLLPWMDGNDAATSYIDLDDLTLNFLAPSNLKVTDFRIAGGEMSISFDTDVGRDYAVLWATDLLGPAYRKRWNLQVSVVHSVGGVRTYNLGAPHGPRIFYVVSEGEGASHPVARILPIGDSITEGGIGTVYRAGLAASLTSAGYLYRYVGSKPADTSDPLRHEGYSGKNAKEIAEELVKTAPSHPADIALIHAGHNFNKGELVLTPTQEADILNEGEAAIRKMVDVLRAANPRVIVLLAKVIPAGKLPKYSYIPALNGRYVQVAAALDTVASPVKIVDQNTGFDPETDTVTDKVHPNADGAAKMADRWFGALAPLLE
ncbi:GDSL-type esterase/lipase family protein [Luteolibacter sp. SL250]|uniref:GDSL-type esterase/lipase family protein n=1 Tax=Luteolibacter sp. SL250 TaxID=2995170 RepID=UPI00226D6A36|nr:GDSL-type esterase/lipase family protein [Luteolibacter sp. SL250]WAC21906.1 GDSL-type esterase/lipase family protein [Luteolibacter sp. SL250]